MILNDRADYLAVVYLWILVHISIDIKISYQCHFTNVQLFIQTRMFLLGHEWNINWKTDLEVETLA